MIFQIAPVIYLASVIIASLFIPFGETPGLLSFEGDFVFFAYILAIGKFLMIIGAMDTGSGFEGMGANREALYSMVVEPAFFIIIGSMTLLTKSVSFHDFYLGIYGISQLTYLFVIVCIFLLLQITLVENSSVPVNTYNRICIIARVPVIIVLDRITHMVRKVADPCCRIGIIFLTECFSIYRFKSLNAAVVYEEKVCELAILVVSDFGIVHKEGTDRYLLVEIYLRGCRIFIGLSHVECSSWNRNHPIRDSHYPALTSSNADQFTLVATLFAAQA
jgi:hypothetical protein